MTVLHSHRASKTYFKYKYIYIYFNLSFIYTLFDLHVTMVTTANEVELFMWCKNPDDQILWGILLTFKKLSAIHLLSKK